MNIKVDNFIIDCTNVKNTVPNPANLANSRVKDIIIDIFKYTHQFENFKFHSSSLNKELKAEGISNKSNIKHIQALLT